MLVCFGDPVSRYRVVPHKQPPVIVVLISPNEIQDQRALVQGFRVLRSSRLRSSTQGRFYPGARRELDRLKRSSFVIANSKNRHAGRIAPDSSPRVRPSSPRTSPVLRRAPPATDAHAVPRRALCGHLRLAAILSSASASVTFPASTALQLKLIRKSSAFMGINQNCPFCLTYEFRRISGTAKDVTQNDHTIPPITKVYEVQVPCFSLIGAKDPVSMDIPALLCASNISGDDTTSRLRVQQY